MNAPRCTCPTKFDEHSKAIVRANTDRFCPVHGEKQHQGQHCPTCRCGQVKQEKRRG